MAVSHSAPQQQVPGLEQIPAALARHGVQFIVIGGWAVQAQQFKLGYLSEDVDVTPARSPENLQRLSDALRDLQAEVRAGHESFAFTHDAESLARAAVWNLRCDHGDFDVCFEPAGVGDFYDLAHRARTVHIEVDGEMIPIRCADLADIVRSKQLSDRPKDRQAMSLLVAQLEQRDTPHRRGGSDHGLGL